MANIARVITNTVDPHLWERARERGMAIGEELSRNGIENTDGFMGQVGQIDVARAVRLNRRYARLLGWATRYNRLALALGFRNMTPDLRNFSLAVARWQKARRIRPADGIIGPNTWKVMRRALRIKTAPASRRAGRASRSSSGEFPMPTREQEDFRSRVLRAHIARSSQRRGGAPASDLRPEQLGPVQGTDVEMRADAARAASSMIAAANSALASAKQRGVPDALRTTRIAATSGYRSRGHQERLWRKYFRNKYYPRTAAARARLAGGPHGDEAVQYMVRYIKGLIAAPGFSNHQDGLAIDLKQHRIRGNEIYNNTDRAWVRRWRATWFFQWLQRNSARYGFVPYQREPWHWVYRPRRD